MTDMLPFTDYLIEYLVLKCKASQRMPRMQRGYAKDIDEGSALVQLYERVEHFHHAGAQPAHSSILNEYGG